MCFKYFKYFYLNNFNIFYLIKYMKTQETIIFFVYIVGFIIQLYFKTKIISSYYQKRGYYFVSIFIIK